MRNKIKETRMQHKEIKTCREVKNRSQTYNMPGEAQEKTIAFPRLRDRGDDHPPTTPVDDIAPLTEARNKGKPHCFAPLVR